MSWLDKLTNYFGKRPNGKSILYFRYAIYFILIFRIFWLFPINSNLIIIHQITSGQSFELNNFLIQPIFYLLNNAITIQQFFMLSLLIIVLAIYKGHSILLAILLFIISLFLNELSKPIINGGDRMHCLLLFVNIFFFTNNKFYTYDFRFRLHNFFLLGIKIHICIFYFISGLDKLMDPKWLNGEALQTVSSLSEYAVNGFQNLNNLHLLTFLSWAAIVFELSFGILIWFKLVRFWVLITGIIFHLFIAIFLSLPDFSLVMLSSYLLFYSINPKQFKMDKTKKPALSSGLSVPNN